MIIKNEANKLPHFLWDIHDLFDDIVIVDTWSTDNSINCLHELWITPLLYTNNYTDERLVDARNLSVESNKCDRVLVLDWDEKMGREDIKKIKNYDPPADTQGFFIKWIDHRYWRPFEDYKMCLIHKTSVKFLFSVHACPQVYIRDNWWNGKRLNGITLNHHPEPKPHREKYVTQLKLGIDQNPSCMRYFRFLWCYYYKHKKNSKAKEYLLTVITQNSTRFPVETLNAHMIIATIYQSEWSFLQSYSTIEQAIDFYELVKWGLMDKKVWLFSRVQEVLYEFNLSGKA